MSKFSLSHRGAAMPLDELLALLARLRSKRSVVPVVGRSGHTVRGNFPTLKAPQASFQSLVEEDLLRVLEVAPTVRVLATHPFVLDLSCGSTSRHYTPDLLIHMERTGALLEAKAAYFLTIPDKRERIRFTLHRLRQEGVNLALVLDTDLRTGGLQDELKALLRLRPVIGRYRQRLDKRAWDPLGRVQPSAEIARRWAAAQAECDALLERVMRRDPDDLVNTTSR